MWERKCQVPTLRGKECGHRTINAIWCWGIRDERFDNPTWVEVCGLHLSDINGWIAHLDTRER